MGHTYAKITIVGPRGKHCIRNVIIDTGSTYTKLSRDVLEKVGAHKLPTIISLELGNGRVVKANTYAIIIKIGDREGPTIAATFKGAKSVVGALALESLGLKVNSVTGKLEETRPKGLAYFYQSS